MEADSMPQLPPAKRTPGMWLFMAAVLGLMALLLGLVKVFALRPRPAAQQTAQQTEEAKPVGEQVLSDGSILRLEQVTYGTQHRFDVRVSASPQPGRPPSRIDRPITEGTSDNCLMLWFTRRSPGRGEALDFSWWSHCLAIDERGRTILDENPGEDAISQNSSSGRSGSRPFSPRQDNQRCDIIAAHSTLRPFRHTGETFTLQVFNTAGEIVAEFDVHNPLRGPFPEWTPEPLPATKTDGDLRVTLRSLRPQWWDDSSNKVRRLAIHPEFEFEQSGQVSKHWTTESMQVLDALGNTAGANNCDLDPLESAWKLRLRLQRNEQAAFDPAETFKIPPIALPAAATSMSIRQDGSVQGAQITILAVGGSGPTVYPGLAMQGGTSHFSGGDSDSEYKIETRPGQGTLVNARRPHILYRVTGMQPQQHLMLQVVDDQARPVTVHPNNFHDVVFGFLKVQPDAKTIEMTFTVQKSREVEFLIAPPQEVIPAK